MSNEVNKKMTKSLKVIFYQLNELWQLDKLIVILHILTIPVNVLLPLSIVYMPKEVVQEITEHREIKHVFFAILSLGIGIMILKICENILEKRIKGRALIVRNKFISKLADKAMDYDYENVAMPEAYGNYNKVYETNFYDNNDNVLSAFLGDFSTLITAVIGFGLYTGILSNMNLWILLIVILGTAIQYIAWIFINKWMFEKRDNWVRVDNKLHYLTWKASEYEAAKDIRLYQMKDWFPQLFHKFMDERVRWTYKIQARYYLGSVSYHFVVFISNGAAYLYLISGVVHGNINAAMFVLYFGIITGFSDWCGRIVWELKSIHQKYLSVLDVNKFMDMKDKTNREEGIPLPTKEEQPIEIMFDHVSYCYPGETKPTISDMNVSIAKGEKVAIVGTNGAGKTTFVKLLCGLFDPTEGTIYINGKDRLLYNRKDYFTLFSTVFQESDFLPVSIQNNITMDEEPQQDRIIECIRQADLSEKIDNLPKGLDTMLEKELNHDAVTLSGGEQQKLMLARALYKNAPVLVLDEPTAALDPIAESNMYQRYNELSINKTSVFISHRLASTRFCDRILLMEQGGIVEDGSHDELLAQCGRYKEMFDIQSQYYKERTDDDEE